MTDKPDVEKWVEEPSKTLDPLLSALVEKLPRGRNAAFSIEERRLWLETMAVAFKLVYGGPVVSVASAVEVGE